MLWVRAAYPGLWVLVLLISSTVLVPLPTAAELPLLPAAWSHCCFSSSCSTPPFQKKPLVLVHLYQPWFACLGFSKIVLHDTSYYIHKCTMFPIFCICQERLCPFILHRYIPTHIYWFPGFWLYILSVVDRCFANIIELKKTSLHREKANVKVRAFRGRGTFFSRKKTTLQIAHKEMKKKKNWHSH